LRNGSDESALVEAFRRAAAMKPAARGDYQPETMRMVGG
jgi:hypothetical protein